jgi:hypothetical protein
MAAAEPTRRVISFDIIGFAPVDRLVIERSRRFQAELFHTATAA